MRCSSVQETERLGCRWTKPPDVCTTPTGRQVPSTSSTYCSPTLDHDRLSPASATLYQSPCIRRTGTDHFLTWWYTSLIGYQNTQNLSASVTPPSSIIGYIPYTLTFGSQRFNWSRNSFSGEIGCFNKSRKCSCISGNGGGGGGGGGSSSSSSSGSLVTAICNLRENR